MPSWWYRPEFIVPLAGTLVGLCMRLTPSIIRDIIEDGIDQANAKDYDLL